MTTYVILIRGINVGGKNKIPMSDLKKVMDDLEFYDVSTYIASGNVILKSDKDAAEIRALIEDSLSVRFNLDSGPVKVLVLTHGQLKAVVDNKPGGFGEEPDKYHSDAIFLIDIDSSEAIRAFDPREGIDKVWPGDGVIYSRRLSDERTRSRLSKIAGAPAYKSMTIRTWNTVTKLLKLMEEYECI